MKISDAGKVAAAIGILGAGLTGFHAPAGAATGRINIQTIPEGAKFLIVESRTLKTMDEGISPYFDVAYPTGKYRVCFELDGYVTVWQDSSVSTFGSSWIGPTMEPSKSETRATCADELARMKTERGILRSSLSEQVKYMEIEHAAPTESAAPADVTPAAPVVTEHDHDHDVDNVEIRKLERAPEIRDRVQEKRGTDRR